MNRSQLLGGGFGISGLAGLNILDRLREIFGGSPRGELTNPTCGCFRSRSANQAGQRAPHKGGTALTPHVFYIGGLFRRNLHRVCNAESNEN
jgi:hypothetical protein